MTRKEIVAALRHLKVETGSIACLGCGWENSCGVHGCRIMREATDVLENDESQALAMQRELALKRAQLDCATACADRIHRQNQELRDAAALVTKLAGDAAVEREWIPVTERLPKGNDQILVVASGKPEENIELVHAVEIASLYDDGWCLETWPEWTGAVVTHWMPLPEAPEVE